MVLLSDLKQAQFLFSNLKQFIERQNDEISQLHNKVVKLQMEKESVNDSHNEILCKIEMIAKEFRLNGIK